MDVFARIMTGLAAETPDNKTISLVSSKLRFDCQAMDAIYLKAHRTASSLRLKRGGRLIGQTKSKSHRPERHHERPPNDEMSVKMHNTCSLMCLIRVEYSAAPNDPIC